MMKMKQNCTHNKEDLVLYYYNETDEAASADVDARLQVCQVCKQYYASLGEMEMVVPRRPSLEPDDAVMSSIRAATASRLREISTASRPQLRLATGRVSLAIFRRLTVVASVLALVFIGGLFAGGSGALELENSSDRLASISDVQYDESTGLINVHYRTERQSMISGTLGDAGIRSMLEMALTDESNPAARLRATKLLAQIDYYPIEPSSDFVSALEKILVADRNVGMQLHAVKALQKVHGDRQLPEYLSLTLMEMLESSPNSALRIEILELLTQSEVARQGMARLLERATTDENSYIRNRARVALDEMDRSVPLEELQ